MNDLKFGRQTISLEEAQRRVLQHVRLQETEEVPLFEAYGRRLAENVCAGSPLPHFRRSGVDGYALRASDTAGASLAAAVCLEVMETVPCGSVPAKTIGPGQAAKIMTGAAVPEGADAVVMLEMTDAVHQEISLGGTVAVHKAMNPGDNVTPVGEEAAAGEQLLQKGCIIGPGEAAVLATFGHSLVKVYKRPRVAIFSTGSELLPVDAPLEPGKIRGSNGYMLACQVQQAGGVPLLMPFLPDEADRVERELLAAAEQADLWITTGGVSVGDKDVLAELFGRWDGELLFNKIAMRPGSPTSVGLWRDKPLFALSGNPGACYVGFELLVRPYLRASQGAPDPLPSAATAILDADYGKGSAYPRYVRGASCVERGTVRVRPAGRDKSSIMVSMKETDCLICLPAGGRGAQRGELVRVLTIRD